MSENQHESPPWSVSTKFIVTVAFIILLIWVVFRFQSLIYQIVAASILAYLLNPVIVFVDNRTPLKRGTSIIVVYLSLAVLVILASIALGFAAVQQVSNLIRQVPRYITQIIQQIELFIAENDPIQIGDVFVLNLTETFDLGLIQDQVIGLVNPAVGQTTTLLQTAAGSTITGVTSLLFIFVISIYIAIEIPLLGGRVSQIAHLPGYRQDAERLVREFGRIWSAYLRGQVILGVVIFVIVWAGLAMMGVQNALALGLLSGLLEFIPIIGPVIGAGAAVIVAFFQVPGFGESQLIFAGVVLLFMFVVQQLENAVLVPRIVGDSLDLHPLVVMLAVFMGSTVAGVLGAILAAPVFATIKLLGTYAWRKMFDQPPFPEEEEEIPPPTLDFRKQLTTLRDRIQGRPQPQLASKAAMPKSEERGGEEREVREGEERGGEEPQATSD